jgi:hypothetical protein
VLCANNQACSPTIQNCQASARILVRSGQSFWLGDGDSLDARRKPLRVLARLGDADEVTNTLNNATGDTVCDAKPGTDDTALHWVLRNDEVEILGAIAQP